MQTENFFDRVSMGQSKNARHASNSVFVFACLCIPGLLVLFVKEQKDSNATSLGSWVVGIIFSMIFLFFVTEIRNFAHGKNVHLYGVLDYDNSKDNTLARWISLIFDLFIVGYICYLAIIQYYRLLT